MTELESRVIRVGRSGAFSMPPSGQRLHVPQLCVRSARGVRGGRARRAAGTSVFSEPPAASPGFLSLDFSYLSFRLQHGCLKFLELWQGRKTPQILGFCPPAVAWTGPFHREAVMPPQNALCRAPVETQARSKVAGISKYRTPSQLSGDLPTPTF